MRITQTLDTGIHRFAALRRGRLAAYRIDGACLGGLVAEIVPVAVQVVAVGRQARASRAVGIACTNLPPECSARANPQPLAPRVAVVVIASEKAANARPAKVCR